MVPTSFNERANQFCPSPCPPLYDIDELPTSIRESITTSSSLGIHIEISRTVTLETMNFTDLKNSISSLFNQLDSFQIPDLEQFEFERFRRESGSNSDWRTQVVQLANPTLEQAIKESSKNLRIFFIHCVFLAHREADVYKKMEIVSSLNEVYKAKKLCKAYKKAYRNLHNISH